MAWTSAVAPFKTNNINNTGFLPNLKDDTKFSDHKNLQLQKACQLSAGSGGKAEQTIPEV